MTFKNLINPLVETRGTYSAIKFSDESVELLHQKLTDLNIPNLVPKDDIHSTLMYSRIFLPEYEATLPKEITGESYSVAGYELFGDSRNILVLLLNAPSLVDHHLEIMSKYKGSYDYPEYIPHVTISYDVKDFCLDNFDLNYFSDLRFVPVIEYSEPLDLSL